jgi:hypothetical protein
VPSVKEFCAFFILKQKHLMVAAAESEPNRPVLELVGTQSCHGGKNYSAEISFTCTSAVSTVGCIHIEADHGNTWLVYEQSA